MQRPGEEELHDGGVREAEVVLALADDEGGVAQVLLQHGRAVVAVQLGAVLNALRARVGQELVHEPVFQVLVSEAGPACAPQAMGQALHQQQLVLALGPMFGVVAAEPLFHHALKAGAPLPPAEVMPCPCSGSRTRRAGREAEARE